MTQDFKTAAQRLLIEEIRFWNHKDLIDTREERFDLFTQAFENFPELGKENRLDADARELAKRMEIPPTAPFTIMYQFYIAGFLTALKALDEVQESDAISILDDVTSDILS